MTIRSFVARGITVSALSLLALLLTGLDSQAVADDYDCLQTNTGLVCKTVETWTCDEWATGGASFGWTSVSVGALCSRYTKTTLYYYNRGTGGGSTEKPLF